MISSLLLAQADGKGIGTVTGIGAFVPVEAKGTGFTSSGTVNELFSVVISFLTIVGGLSFLIYFLLGGLNWILAGGDEKKVEVAKSYMTNGAIGLIIIISSYAIISIVGTILGIEIMNPGHLLDQLFYKSVI